ncbi:MAG: hypothetical protein IJY54_07660, partial [Paludibacteraceae bacterium]|nr:hypothetical protein [Paludibacteraceae bacterium]
MYKGSILKKRSIGVIFTLLTLGAIESQAQCLVGGTDFETSTTLCNPQLANDETGWFSETVATLLKTETAGCSYYDSYPNVIQKGMPTNRLNVPGEMITPQAWTEDSLIQDVTRNKVGYSAIVANPKLISPILSEGSGNNMLVNFGTSHDGSYVLGYSVSGLEPGATVTMSFNLYNLLDLASLKAYVDAAAIKKDIKVCGNTYSVTNDELYGQPDVKVTYSTSLNSNGALNSASSTVAVKPGTSQKITIPAKADAYGTVTFYIGRNGGQQSMPIGIDDIEITATSIKPTASIKPENCFGSMISMSLKNQYPAGTKFDWKEVGGSTISTTSHALFEATTPDKNYSFQCEVTLPDGCSAKTDIATTSVVTCCDDGNGNALPYTDIYFEDFGHFVGNQYTYVDLKGVEKTVTVTDHLENNQTKAFCVEDLKTNGDAFKNIFYNPAIYNAPDDYYAISNESVYTGGVTGDHTTNGNGGGFMMIDLQLSDVYYNQPIFEKQICGLCPDREVTFDVYFAGINGSCPSDGITSRFQLQLVDDATNDLLVDKYIELSCGADWDNFNGGQAWNIKTSSEGCVTMKIIYLDKVIPATGGGDFAIDDIRFQVCTPPDVKVTSSLAAEQLLDLCSDEPLTMSASLSSSAANYYGAEIGYLFQYTYQDPNVVPDEDIVWFDLGDIQTSGDYTIENPSTHEAFINTPVGGESKVFFRVVVGRQSYLENREVWVNMSALSPCRDVSISSAPLTTSLNCAKCYQSGPIDIKGDIVSTIKDPSTGYDVYELCYGEELKLNTADVTTVDKDNKPYADYTIHWYKDDQNGNPMKDMSVSPAAKAKELVVKNNNTGNTAEEHIYYVQTVDNFDPSATNCQNWDAVKVILHPKPDKPSITIPNFCADATAPTVADVQTQVQGYTINWLDADSSVITTDPDFSSVGAGTTETFYLNIADATTGCVSDSASFTVTVDTIPSEVLEDILPFCEGSETAELPTSDKGYEIVWNGVTDVPDLSQVKGATTPQDYTYTLTDPNTSCVSGNLPYTFTVMPIATLTLTVDSVCDKTTITATPVPATATVTWADASTDLVKEITDATQLIDYSATASLAGYCDSETETVAATTLTLTQTPKGLTGGKVQYLKSDMATSVKNLVDQAIANKGQAYSGQSAGTTLYWSAQLAQGTQPGSYTDITSTSVPTPAASSLTNTNDEFYSYWIYETTGGKLDCKSEMKEVQVSILGAPAPKVRDTVYCLNDVPVALDKLGTINQADASKTYELLWTTTKGAAGTTTVPDVSAITAAAGQTKFYVSQAQKDANGNLVNESSQMEIIIDVYEVLMPTAQNIETCKDVPVSLSATAVTDGTHQVADAGFVWFTDTTLAGTPTAPTPDVSIADSTSYFVGQSYELSSGQVCTGPKKEIVVKVNDTDAPAPGTVQFVAADGQSGAGAEEQFPSIVGTDKYEEEAGDYEYFYAEGTDATTVPDISAFSTTEPQPTYDKDQLKGGTHTMYYWVYRKNTKTGCPSKPSLITVNISDAMPPKVKDYYVCQGEAVPDLVAEIQPLGNAPVSQYSLIWYGTDPTSAGTPDDGSCKYTSGQTSATADVTTYYVAQKDNSTGAVSAAMPIKVTILANPVTTITTPPAAVCEQEVDLASTWSVTNVTDKLITEYLDG